VLIRRIQLRLFGFKMVPDLTGRDIPESEFLFQHLVNLSLTPFPSLFSTLPRFGSARIPERPVAEEAQTRTPRQIPFEPFVFGREKGRNGVPDRVDQGCAQCVKWVAAQEATGGVGPRECLPFFKDDQIPPRPPTADPPGVAGNPQETPPSVGSTGVTRAEGRETEAGHGEEYPDPIGPDSARRGDARRQRGEGDAERSTAQLPPLLLLDVGERERA